MREIYLSIIVSVFSITLTILVAIFLPKRIQIFARHLCYYIVTSLWKHIIISITGYSLIIIVSIKFINEINNVILSFFIFFLFLIVFGVLISIYRFYLDLLKKGKGNFIGYTNCISIDNNGVLNVDNESVYLTEYIKKYLSQYSSKHYTFKNKFYQIKFLDLPKFLLPLLGIRKFKEFVKWCQVRGNYFAVLYLIRNVGNKNLQIEILADESKYNYTDPYYSTDHLFNLIVNSELDYKQIVEIISLYYILTFGQSLLDFSIDTADYDLLNNILASSNETLNQIFAIISSASFSENRIVMQNKRVWLCQLEMYTGLYFFFKKEPSQSIKHFLKALSYNLYYPYDNYDEFKLNYSRYESYHVLEQSKKFVEILHYSSDPETQRKENVENIIEDITLEQGKILESIKFRLPTIIDYTKTVLITYQSEELSRYFENEFLALEKEYSDTAIIYLIKYEFFKFLKKGDEKHDKIYLDRISDCVGYLNECLQRDPEFGVVYSKMASMKLITGPNEKKHSKEKMAEIFNLFEKAKYYYEKIGIRMYGNI